MSPPDELPPSLSPERLLSELTARLASFERELGALKDPPPEQVAFLEELRTALAEARTHFLSGDVGAKAPSFMQASGPDGSLIGFSVRSDSPSGKPPRKRD